MGGHSKKRGRCIIQSPRHVRVRVKGEYEFHHVETSTDTIISRVCAVVCADQHTQHAHKIPLLRTALGYFNGHQS
jgi:hypothetical protein